MAMIEEKNKNAGPVRFVNLLAPTMTGWYQKLFQHLRENSQLNVQVVDCSWREGKELFDSGHVQAAAMCGVYYTRRKDAGNPVELLVAPIMDAPRYANRAIYFSEVLVRADSRFYDFRDLQNTKLGINEMDSHSGAGILRYHLTQTSRSEHFSEVTITGSHTNSLQALSDGSVDAICIDTTVLEQELKTNPSIGESFRSLGVLGPSPIPPLVIRESVSIELRHALQNALAYLHMSEAGKALLAKAGMYRLKRTGDRDYQPIRHMDQIAQQSNLAESLVDPIQQIMESTIKL